MLWKIWFDIRNLRRIIFHKCAIRFFPTFYLQDENLTRTRSILSAFLNRFWAFLDHHSKCFDETWWEVRKNGKEADAKDTRLSFATITEISSVKDSQNRPKSIKIYEWSKFFLISKNFLSKFLNGPIQKIIMLNVKFGDVLKNLPLRRSLGSRLQIFFKIVQFAKLAC